MGSLIFRYSKISSWVCWEYVILKEGDVIKCEKDIEHWHSSSKLSDVTYLALYGGGQPTSWTEVVTQEYYDEVAEKLKSN
jgi:hypothetical protein